MRDEWDFVTSAYLHCRTSYIPGGPVLALCTFSKQKLFARTLIKAQKLEAA